MKGTPETKTNNVRLHVNLNVALYATVHIYGNCCGHTLGNNLLQLFWMHSQKHPICSQSTEVSTILCRYYVIYNMNVPPLNPYNCYHNFF